MSKAAWKKEDDWFHEYNIQNKIEDHFKAHWNTPISKADARTRESGPDLLFEKDGTRLHVEVKGYPADKYVAGKNQGQPKKTNRNTQARHWFSESLMEIIKGGYSTEVETHLVLGFPDFEVYHERKKVALWALERLNIEIVFVSEDGKVFSE